MVLQKPNSRICLRVKITMVCNGRVSTLDFLSDHTKVRLTGQLLDSEGKPRAHVDFGILLKAAWEAGLKRFPGDAQILAAMK